MQYNDKENMENTLLHEEEWSKEGSEEFGKEMRSRSYRGDTKSEESIWGNKTIYKLIKSTLLEVVTNDDISDGIENEANVVGVGGTGEVAVHFLVCL